MHNCDWVVLFAQLNCVDCVASIIATEDIDSVSSDMANKMLSVWKIVLF